MPQYHYEKTLDNFKNLEHVLWVADHINDYEFYGSTIEIRNALLERIPKMNTYYGEVLDVYEDFVRAFDNNPYNYRTEVLDGNPNVICCRFPDHYFIQWSSGKEDYIVPVGYLDASGIGGSGEVYTKQKNIFDEGKKTCNQIAAAITNKVQDYMNLTRYTVFGMAGRLSKTVHDVHRDSMLLFLAWLFCLLSFRFNNLVEKALKADVVGSASVIFSVIGLVAGLALFGYLASKTYKLIQGAYMMRRMQQIVAYDQKVEMTRPALIELVQTLNSFDPMQIREMQKMGRKNDLLQLLDLVQMRFACNHFRKIPLEKYGYDTRKKDLIIPIIIGLILLAVGSSM